MGTGYFALSRKELEMRFISTTAVAVEKLKQQAKKTKTKLKIPHADALDRVARGAGYNHWGHVTWCAKETERLADGPSLQKECDYIVEAALNGKGKIVITGPGIVANGPMILFSTEDGDSWLLDPEEELAMCLCWHGQRQEVEIIDTETQYRINWHGNYRLHGQGFHVDVDVPGIGQRVVFGYPIDELRESIQKAESMQVKMRNIFTDRQGEELTEEIIDRLVGEGWKREDLEAAKAAGAEYSPRRNSLLYPMQTG